MFVSGYMCVMWCTISRIAICSAALFDNETRTAM